jgi:tetratricopeptide (TPR) repeat protein
MREATALLEHALAIDPSYAPAAALIGRCRGFQRLQGWRRVSAGEVTEAVRLARQAIEAGKDDPDVLWMAGNTLSFFAGEHATCADAVDRALTLNPNSAHAWLVSGYVSCYRGPGWKRRRRKMRLDRAGDEHHKARI